MICIGTVIKNEQEYLDDWIQYHLSLAIDKIFIVEDFYSESHQEIVKRYSNSVELLSVSSLGLCTYEEENRQNKIQNAIFKYIYSLKQYEWLFIIDIDEYITLQDTNVYLSDVLEKYKEYDELILFWKNYGANGLVYKPKYTSSYREYYTKECDYTDIDKRTNSITKKAINLNKIDKEYCVSHHHPVSKNYICTNFSKNIKEICFEYIYLKHYITKSFQEYLWKLYKRGTCCKNHRKLYDFFEMNKDMIDKKCELLKNINKILNYQS